MANSKALVIYLLFIVFFNFFVGGFGLEAGDESGSAEFNVEKYLIINQARDKLENSDSKVASVISVVLVPFVLLDALIFIFVVIGVGFSVLPAIINVILLTPAGIIVLFDYVLPMVRGN